MRVGLISDIHGDIRALERCLEHIDTLAVDRILCLGDLIGYGHHNDRVVELIRERGIPSIRGNHDRWALEERRLLGLRGWRPAHLSDDTWSYLEALPASRTLTLGGRVFALYHGSPASDTEYVSPYKPLPPCIDEFWGASEATVLALGHTHIPMVERGERGTILNPGSVMGVPGIQTSYSFAVVELGEILAVRIYDIRLGRIIRSDPVWLDDE
jgi:putative phosphoesterase